jgi:Holliday junction resolvasome RuvABC endonuclease subunit
VKALDRLDRLAGRDPRKKPWELLPWAPVRRERLLCFDQTLAKTGWVLLDTADRALLATGMLTTPPLDTGDEGNFVRMLDLNKQMRAVMGRTLVGPYAVAVVHEMPPIGAYSRPESSLLAGAALRFAAESLGLPVTMINSRAAKKRLTGNANAKKSELAAPIEELFHLRLAPKPWNHDVRDAAAIGIVASETPLPGEPPCPAPDRKHASKSTT